MWHCKIDHRVDMHSMKWNPIRVSALHSIGQSEEKLHLVRWQKVSQFNFTKGVSVSFRTNSRQSILSFNDCAFFISFKSMNDFLIQNISWSWKSSLIIDINHSFGDLNHSFSFGVERKFEFKEIFHVHTELAICLIGSKPIFGSRRPIAVRVNPVNVFNSFDLDSVTNCGFVK